MSEDSKRNQSRKNKCNEPKEQRRPRDKAPRQNVKKDDHHTKEAKNTAKTEPSSEDLKRETDVLKITEESNAKYNKKEIQSNWGKYEMKLPSYDDVVEEEDLGDDYEKLIQTGLSAGSHFQFKHEKSWNSSTEPTKYDKYFDIDPNMLSMALGSIIFCDRNAIDQNLFSKADVLIMEERAAKYKARYEAKVAEITAAVDPEIISINKIITEEIITANDIQLPKSPSPRLEHLNKIGVFDDQIVPERNTKGELGNVELGFKSEMEASRLTTTETSPVQSPEDLEKWLDDFLDN